MQQLQAILLRLPTPTVPVDLDYLEAVQRVRLRPMTVAPGDDQVLSAI